MTIITTFATSRYQHNPSAMAQTYRLLGRKCVKGITYSPI